MLKIVMRIDGPRIAVHAPLSIEAGQLEKAAAAFLRYVANAGGDIERVLECADRATLKEAGAA